MKLVTAIIKPFKLDEVREALGRLGATGMTITEVRGYGRQGGHSEVYRGAEYATQMVPKVQIEIACSNDLAPQLVEAIEHAAHTGHIGDGKIFVNDLVRVVRIRTGETDEHAI